MLEPAKHYEYFPADQGQMSALQLMGNGATHLFISSGSRAKGGTGIGAPRPGQPLTDHKRAITKSISRPFH
nr:hypothetical protein BgiMline_005223 [Biomphalaria glabrata]